MRIYRTMLLAYPPEFRREYGGAMLQLLRDQLTDAATQRSFGRLWGRLVWAVIRTAPGLRLEDFLNRKGGAMRLGRKSALLLPLLAIAGASYYCVYLRSERIPSAESSLSRLSNDICSGCGFPYIRTWKLPNPTDRNYCYDCGKIDERALKAADRRRKQKMIDARKLAREGGAVREIARRLETKPEHVRRWLTKGN